MKLCDLMAASQWPYGLILDDSELEIQALVAVRQYMGWGSIDSLENGKPEPLNMDPLFALDRIPGPQPRPFIAFPNQGKDSDPCAPTIETDITFSEWAVIKPLFMLYVEKANAFALEASRVMGVEVFGRAVDTIENDIQRYEQIDMPRLAFFGAIETI